MLVKQIEYIDPIYLTERFANQQGTIFLDSARTEDSTGEYSFIGIDPFLIINTENNLFTVLNNLLEQYQQTYLPDLPPFQGGIAGFIGYDCRHYLEDLPAVENFSFNFPKFFLACFDLIISFNHNTHETWLISTGLPEHLEYQKNFRAKTRLEWLEKKIGNHHQRPSIELIPPLSPTAITSNHTRVSYMQAVRQTIEHILNGDIFEANISQCFTAPFTNNAFALYKKLRDINPAPFSAFIQAGDLQLASASPERFLRLNNKFVESRPIKGTRPRSSDPDADQKLADELSNSYKDWAENVMIVDLMRNDLSKVCIEHSVKVPKLCHVESFTKVHHLVSVVQGQLKKNMNAIDLIKATFPAGSITGAPKIQAMKVIANIEQSLRGPYCGSIGYIGFNGTMDLSVIIRTFAIYQQHVIFQAGGAVVLDSDPAAEYQESLDKAKALHLTLTS